MNLIYKYYEPFIKQYVHFVIGARILKNHKCVISSVNSVYERFYLKDPVSTLSSDIAETFIIHVLYAKLKRQV